MNRGELKAPFVGSVPRPMTGAGTFLGSAPSAGSAPECRFDGIVRFRSRREHEFHFQRGEETLGDLAAVAVGGTARALMEPVLGQHLALRPTRVQAAAVRVVEEDGHACSRNERASAWSSGSVQEASVRWAARSSVKGTRVRASVRH